MSNYEGLALISNAGRAKMSELIATGASFVVDRFVVGDQGHDTSDPTIATTPDAAKAGCYCSPESITVAGGCVYEGLISSVSYENATCPVFTIHLAPGQATGVVSSICLIGTVVYSPVPGDPAVGTHFLFATANMPMKVKVPGSDWSWDISVQF